MSLWDFDIVQLRLRSEIHIFAYIASLISELTARHTFIISPCGREVRTGGRAEVMVHLTAYCPIQPLYTRVGSITTCHPIYLIKLHFNVYELSVYLILLLLLQRWHI